MGRWSAGHWKTATFGWLAFVLVAFALGSAVGTKNVDQNAPGPGESGRMDRILDDGFKQPAGENVLIQSRTHRVGDPAFKAAVADVVARVSKIADVQNVRRGAIAENGRAALVEFDIRGDKDKAVDKIAPVVDRVAAAESAHPGFVIGEFGDASAQKGVETAYLDDLAKAGELSLPITLIILVLTFGALVAAGIPLLLALTAVFATFGLISLPSSVLPVAFEAQAMVLLIGLAVGVDYSMFYLKRWRQERDAGRSERVALEVAAATSGRSVLISGLTVMVSMAGMFLTGDSTFASLGFATILVVAVAVLGSLTVLPALLARLGDKVDRLRVPLVGRRSRDDGESPFWGAIVDRVLRRPALSAAVAAAFLLALAAPALGLRLAPQGIESFPQSLEVIKTYKQMQQAFPGTAMPAQVVVKASSVHTPAVERAIAQLERRALVSGRMYRPITVDVNKAGTVANITVPIAGNGTDAASKDAIRVLRHTIVPQTVGAVANTEAGVTGLTASWQDTAAERKSNMPPVIAFVLLLAFALMLVAFRSIVIAVKAIVLNLLSVAAAYGVLVLVFQHGIGKGLLGVNSADGIENVVPLLLFVILFGLSMDYHVFIISRIRETFDRGATTDEAVAHGIKSTAGVVTSAAIVMVFVFAVFGALSMPFFKQFGVGLAAAILIDATIVRAVLLPATMKLLGDWNWYLPKWLEWLPHFDHGELEVVDEPEPEPEAPAPRRRRRRIGAARITGLLLIALVALGLAYVKLASGGNEVSVPAGAKAGQLTLHPCHYGTEQGSYAADCGTLVVPENRARPGSRLIALPVTRIKARAANPGTPVFRLEGGPGLSNMHFTKANRIAGNHDVVLVGYRGVDGSLRLDCPEVSSALKRSEDILSAKSNRAQAAAFRSCAARLQADGIDLDGYGLPQRVDDLEAARKALGYKQVDLLSESAGTRTAMIYAWRFPRSIHRSVMIAVNPPGHFLWYPQTTDQQIRRYARLCARDTSCSDRTADFAATLRATYADPPRRFWGLPISKGDVREAAFWGMVESTSDAAPLSAPMTIDAWLSGADGDPSGLWFDSLFARLAFPTSFVWGEMAAASRLDARATERYYSSRRPDSIIGNPGSDFLFAGGGLMRAWPANPTENEYSRVRNSAVPTLLVSGELDFATPPQVATRELLPHLSNGHQVVLRGFGHTTTFWNEQPEANERLLNTFLDEGRVDASLYVPGEVDFTPEITQTALGKGLAATLYGLPVVALLSLLLMRRRVRRRGRFGRTASVLLRSLYTLVLGLGGWCAGVVIAQFAFPAVPIDDVRLAILSIGVPVGLGVYLAWVNRDLRARARTIGFLTATASALVGAWLGFHVTTGLMAVITTIVGAAVAANLSVLILDISRDRRVADRLVESIARETLEARPSTG
jgi:RND superfamily putative drug exporter